MKSNFLLALRKNKRTLSHRRMVEIPSEMAQRHKILLFKDAHAVLDKGARAEALRRDKTIFCDLGSNAYADILVDLAQRYSADGPVRLREVA